MSTLWIVKATCSNGARVYISDYAVISRLAVAEKVMAGRKGALPGPNGKVKIKEANPG